MGGFVTTGPNATDWIWALHADAHDFRSHSPRVDLLCARIFASHFGHLALIFAWVGGIYIAGARTSNYTAWLADPFSVAPAAQPVPRTVPGLPTFVQDVVNGDVGGGFASIQITSGVFHIWRAHGITTSSQLLALALTSLALASICIFAGWFHFHRSVPTVAWFSNIDSLLNHHTAGLFGLGSLAWAGHLVHIAHPLQVLCSAGVQHEYLPAPHALITSRRWLELISPGFTLRNLFGLNWTALRSSLTCIGGLDPTSGALWITDIAHHHLAVGVVFIVIGHLYKTDFELGLSISEVLHNHRLAFLTSWHTQLALQLAMQGSVSIWFGHLVLALPAYPYLAEDFPTALSVFVHHQWIGGFFIVGAAAHAALAIIYDAELRNQPAMVWLSAHKRPIIVHLNWVCIFLGFHSFGLYIHNDTLAALGRDYDQFSDSGIVLFPVFAR